MDSCSQGRPYKDISVDFRIIVSFELSTLISMSYDISMVIGTWYLLFPNAHAVSSGSKNLPAEKNCSKSTIKLLDDIRYHNRIAAFL